MIPTIEYDADLFAKVEGQQIPTMYFRYWMPKLSTSGQHDAGFSIIPVVDDTPDSFARGMREIAEGHAIDFDSALSERPPPE